MYGSLLTIRRAAYRNGPAARRQGLRQGQSAGVGGGHVWIVPRNLPGSEGPAESWPGAEHGVRQPEPEETSLSWSEVHFAVARGVL